MAKKKATITVEDRLKALYQLQMIDSEVDKIRIVRGELPLEVEDLQDEVTGLNTRLSNLSEDVSNLETDINNKKLAIEESNTLMKKYEEQQKNVRNNREFDSLSKETEYQELEIQTSEKRIKQFQVKKKKKNEVIATTKEKLDKQQVHLDHKKAELDTILKETEKEEKILLDKSKEFSASIDDHLLSAYTRIRNIVRFIIIIYNNYYSNCVLLIIVSYSRYNMDNKNMTKMTVYYGNKTKTYICNENTTGELKNNNCRWRNYNDNNNSYDLSLPGDN